MITLTQYIDHRLGNTPKEQAKNFLGRPFGSQSLSAFWQYWNPVWGYYLFYYCYRPLRRFLPRSVAVLLTFFFCGLIHDLPFALAAYLMHGTFPLFTLTVFFSLIGFLVVITEIFRIRFANSPIFLRWILHSLILFLCYWAAIHLTVGAQQCCAPT